MYDVIVVGARCAGSPTALLLARRGYKVLLVDRAAFPSDTMSTHFIQQAGVALLGRWGLLDEVAAGGSDPINKATIGNIEAGGGEPFELPEVPGVPGTFAPRRTRLDKLLLDAAVNEGVEVRERFTFEDVIVEGGRVCGITGRDATRSGIEERARLVVGADGRHSSVAEKVGASFAEYVGPLIAGYYSYWSGIDSHEIEIYFGKDATIIMFPTDDDLHTVIGVRSVTEAERLRRNFEEGYLAVLHELDLVGERIDKATREERIVGSADLPNYLRTSVGPGWALVGDAAYHKDPTPADGITDAFIGVDLLVEASDKALSNGDAGALDDYQQRLTEIARPHLEATVKISSFEYPPEERMAVFGEHAAQRYMEALEIASVTASL